MCLLYLVSKKENQVSPAQIRTGVKGSKGLYAWPLHSANLEILYRAAGHFFIEYLIYKATNLSMIFISLSDGSSI